MSDTDLPYTLGSRIIYRKNGFGEYCVGVIVDYIYGGSYVIKTDYGEMLVIPVAQIRMLRNELLTMLGGV